MRVLVDFNEVHDDNLIWAPRSQNNVTQGELPLRIGTVVELYDYDGTSCLARVAAMTDQTIDCEIDWDTVEYVDSHISQSQVYETGDIPWWFDPLLESRGEKAL
jgi:hypothetical protein